MRSLANVIAVQVLECRGLSERSDRSGFFSIACVSSNPILGLLLGFPKGIAGKAISFIFDLSIRYLFSGGAGLIQLVLLRII